MRRGRFAVFVKLAIGLLILGPPALATETRGPLVADAGDNAAPDPSRVAPTVVRLSVATADLKSDRPRAPDRLGVFVAPLDAGWADLLGLPPGAGVVALAFDADSPAGRAGLRIGDVVRSLGGRPIATRGDFNRALAALEGEESAAIEALRPSGGSLDVAALLREAAAKGSPQAALALGYQDFAANNSDKAMSWFRKAADQGFALGQYLVGFGYFSGRGATQDFFEAMEWYRKAADQGDAFAEGDIGTL